MNRNAKRSSAVARTLSVAGLLLLATLTWAGAPKAKASVQGPHENSADLVLDGKIPGEGTGWMEDGCVYWEGEPATAVVIDLGGPRLVKDLVVQVDNNDGYFIEWSADGKDYAELFTIRSDFGEIDGGMDTFSTVKGDGEYEARIDFKPVTASFIRLKAVDGDEMYSVSEIQVLSEDPPSR